VGHIVCSVVSEARNVNALFLCPGVPGVDGTNNVLGHVMPVTPLVSL
jgi:hypothetical protein